MEAAFEKACQDGTIPGSILMAADKSGTFKYAKSFGVRSLKTQAPLEINAILFIASCTKLMTSIAAMQCIERGQASLDMDVSRILPDLAKAEILTSFDDAGEPILKKRENIITLRHLLTHSAGLSYERLSPKLARYRKQCNEPLGTGPTVPILGSAPLLYEPGTKWMYSTSIDWAGKLIERITGETLEKYMNKNIWQPLGITEITFWPDKNPKLKSRKADMTIRDPHGKLVHDNGPQLTAGAKDCFGGHGASASMPDYLKILQSILKDDEKLLKKETTAIMFQPQLSTESREAMKKLWSVPAASSMFVGEFPHGIATDWGIGGLLIRDTTEGWRRKDTLVWSGLPNLFWFIDREAGLCGLFGCQVKPPGDERTGEMITLFEKAMYERLEKTRARL